MAPPRRGTSGTRRTVSRVNVLRTQSPMCLSLWVPSNHQQPCKRRAKRYDDDDDVPSVSHLESLEPGLVELRHSLATLQQQLLDQVARTTQLEQENRELRCMLTSHTPITSQLTHLS